MWDTLRSLHGKVQNRSLLGLFDVPDRAADFSATTGDLLLDYSKTNLDAEVLSELFALADKADVAGKRNAMFAGAPINETEGRAVLHTALRNLDGGPVLVDGLDVMPEVHATLDRMAAYAREVRAGTITDVVNIGIGGSDRGPAMAVLAFCCVARSAAAFVASRAFLRLLSSACAISRSSFFVLRSPPADVTSLAVIPAQSLANLTVDALKSEVETVALVVLVSSASMASDAAL